MEIFLFVVQLMYPLLSLYLEGETKQIKLYYVI